MADDRPDSLIDPLEDTLGYQLRRATLVTVTALAEAYEALDLKMSEAAILRFVAANPGCNQSAIGRALGVKRTNMVPIVAGLEARGLLLRPPADGRSNALHLTDAGTALLGKVEKAGAEIEARFYGDVPGELRALLIDLCRQVRAKGEG